MKVSPSHDACGRTRRTEAPGFVISEFVLGAGYEGGEHAHALHGIVLPLAGEIELTVGTDRMRVAEGEALLLPCGMAHGERTAERATCLLLEPAGGDTSESPRLFDRLARLNPAELRGAAARLARALRADSGQRWQHEYAAVEVMLHVDQAGVPLLAGRGSRPRWMRRALECLRETFRDPPSLREVAREAGVSREHLARQFRLATGVPAGEFVRRRRVLEAVRLLRDSSLTIGAVAVAAGFSDQSHLSRQLRRYLGTTPRRIRTAGS